MLHVSGLRFSAVVGRATLICRRASRRPKSRSRKSRKSPLSATSRKSDVSKSATLSRESTATATGKSDSNPPHVVPLPSPTIGSRIDAARLAPQSCSHTPESLPNAHASSPVNVAQSSSSATPAVLTTFSRQKLSLVTPPTLQARLRSLMVQLVLLSPSPLTPQALHARVQDVMDQETTELFVCAAHAVELCDVERKRSSSRRKREVREGAPQEIAASDQQQQQQQQRQRGVKEKAVVAADAKIDESVAPSVLAQELMRVGEAFRGAYQHSVIPLVAALRRAEAQHAPGAAAAATAHRPAHRDGAVSPVTWSTDVPAAHAVSEWMLLHLVFSDPEFRVSAYSGAVCFPTLPSLLLAQSDRLQEPKSRLACLELLQTTSPLDTTPSSQMHQPPLYRSQGPHGALVAHETPTQAPPPDASNFCWLGGAAGRPAWTTAHAMVVLCDVSHASGTGSSAVTAAEVPRRQSPERSTGPASLAHPPLDATAATKKTIAAGTATTFAATSQSSTAKTSGHPLVDYVITHAAAAPVPAALLASGDVRAYDKLAAKAHPTMGWNEGTHGSTALQHCVGDLADVDGLFNLNMARAATLRQPSGEFYWTNQRLIFAHFHKFVGVPISVSRLSTMLRWNLSLHNAGIYRAFFHFLLAFAANVTVHRLACGVRDRVAATLHCADAFGKALDERRHPKISKSDIYLDNAAKSNNGVGYGRSSRERPSAVLFASAEIVSKRTSDKLAREVHAALRELAGVSSSTSPPHGTPETTEEVAVPALAAQLQSAFAIEGETTRKMFLHDDRVMEMLCLRVQPHARPGSSSSANSFYSRAPSVTFRGFPLRYIEVLPTWTRSPEETLRDLYQRHCAEHATSAEESTRCNDVQVCAKNSKWLETHEEPYLLVCPMAAATVRDRLRMTAARFAALTDTRTLTLRQLSFASLWAHEYGVAMACEMLLVQLLLNPQWARVHPPASTVPSDSVNVDAHADGGSGGVGGGDHARALSSAATYEDWTVEFV